MLKEKAHGYRLLGYYKMPYLAVRYVWMERETKDIIIFVEKEEKPTARFILSDFREMLRLGDIKCFVATQIGRAVLGV